MQNEKLDQVVLNKLNISKVKKSDLSDWKSFVNKIKNPKTKLKIGLIEYVELQDSYNYSRIICSCWS